MPEIPVRSLADRKRDNPDAFKFDKPTPEPEAPRPSLSVVLGGHGEPITRTLLTTGAEIVFYPHSPTLRSLAEIEASKGTEHQGGEMEMMISLCTHILWIYLPDGTRRRATFDEIADSMPWEDKDLLSQLLGTYIASKVRRGAEGNV